MADDARATADARPRDGAREAAGRAARCALEVEYAAGGELEVPASLVNNNALRLAKARPRRAARALPRAKASRATPRSGRLRPPGGPGGQPARLVNALGEGGAVPPPGEQFAFPNQRAGDSAPVCARPPERREVRGDSSGTCCPRVRGAARSGSAAATRRDLGVGTCLVVVAATTRGRRRGRLRRLRRRGRVVLVALARRRARSSPLVARTRGPAAARQVVPAGDRAHDGKPRDRVRPAWTATVWCDRTATVFVFFQAPSERSRWRSVGRDGRDAAVGRPRRGATSSRRVRGRLAT